MLGQDLYTTRADIYRALIEATAFGARAIIERIQEYGVRIDQVVCTGGIAEKNPLLMQIYADVTGCVMQVAGSSQTCALGSAIAAAVLAGAHPDFASAEAAMTSLKPESYQPVAENRAVYDQLYALYRELHDSFGGLTKSADLSASHEETAGHQICAARMTLRPHERRLCSPHTRSVRCSVNVENRDGHDQSRHSRSLARLRLSASLRSRPA